jgi:F-type H+-transporting ATPase subunit b
MDFHHIILSVAEAAQHAAAAAAPVTEAAAETAQENPGVVQLLGINWKLFLAQLVNFAIVLFIFWKWIVKPLGKTLTQRQEKIEKGLKNAEQTDRERRQFEEEKLQEMRKTRAEADKVLRLATDSANKIKQETIAETQNQAVKLMEQAKASIESEKLQMLKDVKQEIATLVVSASEKILKSKLDSKKDSELIGDSIKSIK